MSARGEKIEPFLIKRKPFGSVSIPLQLGLLTFVGFIVRILLSQFVSGGITREWDQGDEGGYAQLAMHMVQGLGYSGDFGIPTSWRVPGLPLLLTIPIGLIGPEIVAIRVFMCFVESLLIPTFYLLVRSVTRSANLALVASIIGIFFPTWLIPAGAVMSDVPAAILVTLMVWMLIEGNRRQSFFWIIGAGILWGAATLVRPIPLAYAPGIILWLVLVMPSWKRRLAAACAVIVPFFCLLAPWTVRNMQIHGAFVGISTQAGSELYIGNHPGATGVLAVDFLHWHEKLSQRYPKHQFNEVTRNALYKADAINFIREDPWSFAERCAVRFIQLWKIYSPRVSLEKSLAVIATFGLALPFFLLQAIRRGWQRGPEMLFLFVIICHSAVHMVFTSNVRYRIPMEPLVLAMAIPAFCWAFERLREYSNGLRPVIWLRSNAGRLKFSRFST